MRTTIGGNMMARNKSTVGLFSAETNADRTSYYFEVYTSYILLGIS